ncbi:MAG TPA: hypothetical protein PLI95_19340 [Polyangiaceae bacterium]|nr:hypothetical protein [Polyangiaceae bacterium]
MILPNTHGPGEARQGVGSRHRFALLLAFSAVSACARQDDADAYPPAKHDGGWGGEASVAQDSSIDRDSGGVEDSSAEAGCEPTTCSAAGAECGSIPDGCGGEVACGSCSGGKTCGGGGPNLCGTSVCEPKTCAQIGASCGIASDTCSETIDCGMCPVPQTCGGGGTQNECGCTPKTCAQLGVSCGAVLDGCGKTLDCGGCPVGQSCGGGGPNKCGTGSCVAKTCVQLKAGCGLISDGCSKTIDCGECSAPETCGGSGEANECGCVPKTCAQLGASCGMVQSGCGFEIDCGNCPNGETCGAAGVPNQCGCVCSIPHGTAECQGGACVITGCDAGWDDCDQLPANGCEANLTADPHCGVCGKTCDDGNACTVGDACEAGSCKPGTPKSCTTPPNSDCYQGSGSCDPATGNCSYPSKPNGTECGATTCGAYGACAPTGECSASGTKERSCTDHKCQSGTCSPSSRTESAACSLVVTDGSPCSAGYCCSNACVPRYSNAHCGACGVECYLTSCQQIAGANPAQFSCTCTGDAYCKNAGFGPDATCYDDGKGQQLCDCQCPGGALSCYGECPGGALCADVSGHNYCHY